MRKYIRLSLLLLVGFNAFAQDCSILGPIDILEMETTDIVLSVSNLINEDLSSNQEICGIRLVFDHNQLENIRISLSSPAGDIVTFIGPGTLAGDLTSLILWDISFNPCSNPTSPDPGFLDQWDSDQAWSSFETYTGIYHPFQGCLEDFNTGSANGDWVLTIENLGSSSGTLQYFELIFCNDTGTECSDCFLFSGDLEGNFELFCESDNRLDDISEYIQNEFIVDSDQDFTYILYTNDTIIDFNQNFTSLDTLSPNMYTICGLAFENADSNLVHDFQTIIDLNLSLANQEFCGDISNECFVFEILESNTSVIIDTFLCRGDTLKVRDLIISENMDTVITVFDTTNVQPFVINCDSVYNIHVEFIDIEAVISSPGQLLICGNTLFLNASSSSSTFGPLVDYQWSTIDGTLSNLAGPITEALAGGTYYLNIDDSICSDFDSIVIAEQNEFNVDIEQREVLCFNDTLIADITYEFPPDSSFLFGPNIVSLEEFQFSTLESGQYILESYYRNCVSSDTIDLINDAAPLIIGVSYDTIDCLKMSASVEIMINRTNPEITYAGPEPISDNDFFPEILVAGLYFLTVTDDSGCTATEIFEIIDNTENPSVDLMPVNISCNEGAVPLPLSSNMTIDSVQWTGPLNFNSNELNPFASDPGTYIVQIFALNGCSSTDSLVMTVTNETILFNITGQDIDCDNPQVELCIQSGQALDSISWIFQNLNISNDACIMSTEVGDYFVEVYDENGCFGVQEYSLANLISPIEAVINANGQTIFCGNQLELDASNSQISVNSVLSWYGSANQTLSSALIYQTVTPGTFYFEIFDTLSQCSSTDSILINFIENPFLEMQFEIQHPLCFGEIGQIQIDNYPTISDFDLFLNGELITNNDSIFTLSSGQYLLEFDDNNGCFFDTLLNIFTGELLDLDLGPDVTVDLGSSFPIDAQVNINEENIVSYVWSHPELLSCISCLNPDILLEENVLLSLEIEDLNGCIAIDEISIFTDNTIDFFVPNIFTPNGDGDNDILTIYISDRIQNIFDFQIIDRWGNLLIFHPEIVQKGYYDVWNGSSQNEFVVDGVYVYVATLLLIDNSEVTIFGNITLLK